MDGLVPDTETASSRHVITSGTKPHSTPLTLKWLQHNYEVAEGVCIPRSTLYVHYLNFCQLNNTNPVNAASFGKIIRQQFPEISTRRLGTRGQSKYHYYGIGVRACSQYYDLNYSAKIMHSSCDVKKNTTVGASLRSKINTRLPQFPDVSDIKLPPDVDEDKVTTLLTMYQTHCQRLLDSVMEANFDEIHNLVLHFWQGMPSQLIPLLNSDVIVKLVGLCDSLFYKAVVDVLIPTAVRVLPDSLSQVVRQFGQDLETCLTRALQGLPAPLQAVKLEVCRRFSQSVKRQTSLSHLVQAAGTVLTSTDITSQMLSDWMKIDLSSIARQTLYTMDNYTDREHTLVLDLCASFEKLLDEQVPVEAYLCWLEKLVQCCVIKGSQRRPGSLRSICRQFLLMWSCFGTRVIRDMTLHGAASFGSFHLLHLMCDDYILFLMESLHTDQRRLEFMRAVKGETIAGDSADDIVLPDATQIKEFIMSTSTLHEGHSMNKMNNQFTIACVARDNIYLDYDSPSGDYTSDDDDDDDVDTYHQVSSSILNEVTDDNVINTCINQPSSDRMNLDYPPAGQHQQQAPLYPQQHYTSNQGLHVPPGPTQMLHPEPDSVQPSSPGNYMIHKHAHDNQSSWTFMYPGGEREMTPGLCFRNSSQQALYSEGTACASLNVSSANLVQFPQYSGRSCQPHATACASVNYHGCSGMPQTVPASYLDISGNTSMKRKLEYHHALEERFKHTHLSKRPSVEHATALQQYGMDLL